MNNYFVEEIPFFECKEWLLYKHYAKRIPSITYSFGLYENKILVGVCTFGTPCSSTLLNGVCGKDYSKFVIELNRLVIDCNKKNIGSFFISQCLKKIDKPKIIISFADTKLNHHGYIYQATNWIYTGLSTKFLDPMIKGKEHQHHGTFANRKTNKQLKEIYGDDLYFIERSRKHRYIYFLGSKKEKKNFLNLLNYKIEPYPKGENKKYDAGYQPIIQKILF